MASYTSTGPAGVDAEVTFSAVVAAHLISEQTHPILPYGAIPATISLQRRDGPAGFDDLVIEWVRDDDSGVVYVQSKRPIAISNNSTFRSLARALAEYECEGEWCAAIVATSITPNLEDVQVLLESSRLATSHSEFKSRWSETGVLNDAKRTVLEGFESATDGLNEDAVWNAMRRLRVFEHDLALRTSRDRSMCIQMLSQRLANPFDAEASFDAIRAKFLASAHLSPTYDRAKLALEVPTLVVQPRERDRKAIDKIHAESSNSIVAIDDRIEGAGCSISLLRPEISRTLEQSFASHKTVRLQGDAGSGKSSLLKRYSATSSKSKLVLNERRVSGRTWSEVTAKWGSSISAQETIDAMSLSGDCLLAIDGADRMLLDHRRGVVMDLFRAIAGSPFRERWSIITSARDFGPQDIIHNALSETNIETGKVITVGSLKEEDLDTVAKAFPNIGALVKRSDLAGLNNNPFMLGQLLATKDVSKALTEVELAEAWATRGSTSTPADHRRDRAVAQLAASRLSTPTIVAGSADLDAEGVATLVAEGTVQRQVLSGGIQFSHDVFDDWALAREMARDWRALPTLLKKADEPLWWQRAVRLVALIKLEQGLYDEWSTLYSLLKNENDMDPAWARLVLAAPLHSERSEEHLLSLNSMLLDQEGKLLSELLETLRIFETRIDQRYLGSPVFADMNEAERLQMASYFKEPVLRPWLAFFRWSIGDWTEWPENHIPALVEVSTIWTQHYERFPNWISKRIGTLIKNWLLAVEDYEHPKGRWRYDAEREPPFALELRYDGWEKLERDLQRTLTMCAASAPDLLKSYLCRLTTNQHLRAPRERLLEAPRQLPTLMPEEWVDMLSASLLRKERQRREGILGPSSCFESPTSFHDAGISDEYRFSNSSPHQLGWDQLFANNPEIALTMMHRLEMRAAVYWRNREKRREGRKPRPLILHLNGDRLQLWGDETVYRWSRAILGPHSLGSAYLALDNWLHEQLGKETDLKELLPQIFQNNGLVSTAAPVINAVAHYHNNRPALSAIAPLLAAPRLWNFDIRRHMDDRSPTHRIGGFGSGQHHQEATEEIWKRYHDREPFHLQLLLPFHLMADQEAQAFLQERRVRWALDDLADFEHELESEIWRAETQGTLERYLSDADPKSVRVDETHEADKIVVRLEPPKDVAAALETQTVEHARANSLSELAVWAERSAEAGEVDDAFELQEAVDRLNELVSEEDALRTDFSGRMIQAASAGVASVLATLGPSDMIRVDTDWVRDRLLNAIHRARPNEETMLLVPESLMSFDPQTIAASGIAALASRGFATDLDTIVAELATHQLHAVEAATLKGLDWERRPDFSWRCVVAALDTCVFNSSYEWDSPRRKKRAQRSNIRRHKKAVRFVIGSRQLRGPVLPPKPFHTRLIRTRKAWPPVTNARFRVQTYYHGGKFKTLIENVPFDKLGKSERGFLLEYFLGLVEWARFLRDEDEKPNSYGSDFPHELVSTLAKQIGRLAAVSPDNDAWKMLTDVEKWQYKGDLIGTYLDAVAHDLIVSERPPDDRFWRAWQPAADWVLSTLVPERQSDGRQSLGNAVRAAGFVGPYLTPIPPNWPHLELLLPRIDGWVKVTKHNASAANAVLSICERMSLTQLEEWYVPWLALYNHEHGSDADFWLYAGFSDKAAGLLALLEGQSNETRIQVRRILSVMADSGSIAAREVLPRFASQRPR